jgi:hypothetical protein
MIQLKPPATAGGTDLTADLIELDGFGTADLAGETVVELDVEFFGLGLGGGDGEFERGEHAGGVEGAPAVEPLPFPVEDVHPRARGVRVAPARRQRRRGHEQIVVEFIPVLHPDLVHLHRHPVVDLLRHPHKPQLRLR